MVESLNVSINEQIKKELKDVRNFPFDVKVGSMFRTAGKSVSNKMKNEKYYASAYFGDEKENFAVYKILKKQVSEVCDIEEKEEVINEYRVKSFTVIKEKEGQNGK